MAHEMFHDNLRSKWLDNTGSNAPIWYLLERCLARTTSIASNTRTSHRKESWSRPRPPLQRQVCWRITSANGKAPEFQQSELEKDVPAQCEQAASHRIGRLHRPRYSLPTFPHGVLLCNYFCGDNFSRPQNINGFVTCGNGRLPLRAAFWPVPRSPGKGQTAVSNGSTWNSSPQKTALKNSGEMWSQSFES